MKKYQRKAKLKKIIIMEIKKEKIGKIEKTKK